MKSFSNLFLMAAIVLTACVTFASCSDDDKTPQSYKLTINLNYKEGLAADNVSSLRVVTVNDKGQNDTIKISGTSTTVTVIEGQYQIVASGKVTDEAAAYASGRASVDVFSDVTVTVDLSKIVQSPIIFKAIYSTGGQNRYVLDQYFELVNNSDEIQYLDGLILSAPQGNQTHPNAWQANGHTDLYACGQGVVIAFPGSGTDYPLQPGQSIVLANDAVNHHENAGAGNLCPDLSAADWEVYISNVKGEVDYPAPNVKVIFQNNTSMKAFGLGFFGRGYLIARCPVGVSPEDFAANKANIMTTPGTTSKMEFLMIPSKYVLDAVDIWHKDKTEHYGTFLPKDDAQGILASASYTGKCVRRKVTKIEKGRAYYQDTNNSSNDFLREQELTPGKTPTVAD